MAINTLYSIKESGIAVFGGPPNPYIKLTVVYIDSNNLAQFYCEVFPSQAIREAGRTAMNTFLFCDYVTSEATAVNEGYASLKGRYPYNTFEDC